MSWVTDHRDPLQLGHSALQPLKYCKSIFCSFQVIFMEFPACNASLEPLACSQPPPLRARPVYYFSRPSNFIFISLIFGFLSFWHKNLGRAFSQKRQITDWVIKPHTKWCGNGRTADKYTELGGDSALDMCCRKHDLCKYSIQGLDTKWDYFNMKPYSLSHCKCDMRLVYDLFLFI